MPASRLSGASTRRHRWPSRPGLIPVSLRIVTDKEELGEWHEYVDRYHEFGCRHPLDSNLCYYVCDRTGRKLGCLSVTAGVRLLSARDAGIGWDTGKYRKYPDRVVGNTRFLILPWMQVKNLDSKVLSVMIRQLAGEG